MVDRIPIRSFTLVLMTSLLIGPASGVQERVSPDGIQFFTRHIWPVLAKDRYSCHSESTDEIEDGLPRVLWMTAGATRDSSITS